MSSLYMLCFVAGVLLITAYITNFKWELCLENSLVLLVFIALAVRLLATKIANGFPNDIDTFKYWADLLFESGLKSFYTQDVFTDYPPGYMYVLYILGFLRSFFHIQSEYAHTLLIKMPGILFDLASVVFLFKIAAKKMEKKNAWLLALLYALNPAVILASSVWGQVDCVYTFFIALSLYFLTEKMLISSYALYAVAILVKPQAFMFAPIYLFSVREYFKARGKLSFEGVLSFTDNIFPTIFVLLCGILPFTTGFNLTPIIKQYMETLASYPHATINAANIYALFNANWGEMSATFLSIPYYVWSIVFIVLTVAASFYLLFKNNSKGNYFFVAALINVCTFLLCVKMHERYIFPSIMLLLIAYIYRRHKDNMLLYCGFTITFFANCAMALHYYVQDKDVTLMAEPLAIIGMVNVILLGFMFYSGRRVAIENNTNYSENYVQPENIPIENFEDLKLQKSKVFVPLTNHDFKLIAILTVLTAIMAFTNLGDRKAPESLWAPNSADSVVIELPNNEYVGNMQYYVGITPNEKFYINTSEDGRLWVEGPEVTTKGVFSWKEVYIGVNARYIKITPDKDSLTLFEVAFRDIYNELIIPASQDAPALVDEQNMVPETSTYMNSTYFDEIYHARTAYEMLHGIKIYENTHPPLGKAIIAIGISLFGMNPFGWRCMGALFGVLMVPLMYLFAKWVFNSSKWALFASLLVVFDFMRFTQTRIATIDTYITFFIICMYYFMYKYYTMSFYDTPFKKTLVPLFFSGLFMGIGVACKWPGVYAGAGLAVLFFYTLYKRYREYRQALTIGDEEIAPAFPRLALKTVLCCVLFFVVIPVIIYGLSYITYMRAPNFNSLKNVLDNQVGMWEYHSQLESTHPYSSEWWKWPIMWRPIFYYSKTFADGLKAGISAFGNPAIWWLGIIAFFYSIYLWINKKDKAALFLVIAYLAQYLPWVSISRTTYIYHYFPSTPFVILMITLLFKRCFEPKAQGSPKAYMVLVIGLFALFYPALSGLPAFEMYFRTFLKWFPSWVLII